MEIMQIARNPGCVINFSFPSFRALHERENPFRFPPMKTNSVHYSKLANRIARQTARFASVATSDTIHGGARALSLAKHFDRFHVNFSDGVSAAEIVSHVYGNSTGRTCERFGAFECPECGCVALGLEMALACCTETEEEIDADTLDGSLDGLNLDCHFLDANELREHGEEMEGKGAPSAYVIYASEKADAMELRHKGEIAQAIAKEHTCEKLFQRIPDAWKW